MRWLLPFCAVLTVFAAGCFKKPGDVFVKLDGSIIEGELVSIESGQIIFEQGSAEISGSGRIWMKDGQTFSGDVFLSQGVVGVGTHQAPSDSLMLVVWGDTDLKTGSFTVQSSSQWVDTGIELHEGDILVFLASGSVLTETGVSTPDGQEEFSSSVALAPGATSGQLVFKVGDQGSPVAAGSNWVGESPANGVLMLAVNVPWAESIESEGTYTVHVTSGSGGRDPGTAAFYPATR